MLCSMNEFLVFEEKCDEDLKEWDNQIVQLLGRYNIVHNLLSNYNLTKEIDKHVTPIPRLYNGKLAKDISDTSISHWYKPYKIEKYMTKIYHKGIDLIFNFLDNKENNVLTIIMRAKHAVGCIYDKERNEYKELYWYCVVIEKRGNKLITKTTYPCENPFPKDKNA